MNSAAAPGEIVLPLARGERIYQTALSAALAWLGFFTLFSSAGISIGLGMLVILCVLRPRRVLQRAGWREPVGIIGLVLLAWIALRTAATSGFNGDAFDAVNRYHELLLLPLLWALVRTARRPNALVNGLMLGAVAFATAHWLAPLSPDLEQFLHDRRISGGFGLAVCAFLLFEHARLGRLPAPVGYGLAGFIALTLLFASNGRTGHIVLLLLMLCAAWRAAPPRLRLAVAVATLGAAIVVGYCSSSIRSRMGETWTEMQAGQSGERAAPESRTELLRTGLEVVRGNWVWGTGWGLYPKVFSEIAERRRDHPAPAGNGPAVNPHNEYVLQLGAGGVPALILFMLWLGWPMWRALRERGRRGPWAGAVGCVALAFAVSALFNSVLRDFTEAHFYVAVLAWLLERRVHRVDAPPQSDPDSRPARQESQPGVSR